MQTNFRHTIVRICPNFNLEFLRNKKRIASPEVESKKDSLAGPQKITPI